MDPQWAADRLEQIRLLMDRSASYRRALAPTTIASGIIGVGASAIGWHQEIQSLHSFTIYWQVTAVVTLVIALGLIRRQSLKSNEPFWSVPTCRVAEAMVPPFTVGFLLGLIPLFSRSLPPQFGWTLPSIWMILYGCGLHSAGFFMPRGIKLFGLVFIVTGTMTLIALTSTAIESELPNLHQAHLVMGGSFGALHLFYGAYLYLTETTDHAH